MKCTPEKNDPFSFEGPEIYKCKVSNYRLVHSFRVNVQSLQTLFILR